MTRIYLGTRRLSATGALALAFSLQICGCSAIPDCQRILKFQLSSLASAVLRERCADCMTAQQVPSTVYASGRVALAESGSYSGPGATIQQALHDEEGALSPDWGGDTGGSSLSAALDNVEIAGKPSPTRPAASFATSVDARFTSWPIAESVYFIYQSVAGGEAQRRAPVATAFILSVPDANGRTMTRFLVTARHVVDPEWAHCPIPNPASMEVRFNRRDGGVGYERISLIDRRRGRYFVPADGASDIAIFRLDRHLVPDLDAYKLFDTPFSVLPTSSDLRAISGNDQVVTASAQAQTMAGLDAFPVTGRSVLSSTTSDPVDIRCSSNLTARSLSLWFIGGFVQRGVSGAPVYASLVRDGDISPTTVLLGVQAIAWPDRGLAGITPSTVLADLVQTALAGDNGRPDFYRGVTH